MNTRASILKFCKCLPVLVALLLCSTFTHAASLIVKGIDDELKENVELVAGEIPEDERLLALYIELLPSQTRKALAAYGYFEPEVAVDDDTVGEDRFITVTVNVGSPVLVNSINVDVTGDGENDATFKEALERIPLKLNEIFLSGEYEATKSVLLDAAQAKGYFNFKFITNAVLVSRANRTAIVNLVAESGPRFTFGTVKFDQNIFSEEFLSRWAPFKPNDPYDASLLSELNDNLQNSGYFRNVRVAPQRDVRYGATVPVLVSLSRKESNQVGLGIGYSTAVEGVRGKLTWGKPLINRQGHSADAELNLSQVSQSVSFAYRIPRTNRPLYNYWGVEYGLQSTQDDSGGSFLSRLNFERVRRFRNEWNESVFLRWERERFTLPDEENSTGTDLVLPGIAYSRKRSKGAPFITWGQSSSFEATYGNRKLLSSIDFAKIELKFKYIRAVSPRNTFIFALQYGAIESNDFDKVPTTQRFFAGGDLSIRGYDSKQVSPEDSEGNPIGGRYLETASIEYAYRFTDRWSFAVFTDGGRAFNNFSTSQQYGAGFGLRWQSPVGPFRIDLATPVGEGSDNSVRVHLSLGPEL